MPASTIQEAPTATQAAVQGHRRSPRNPRAKTAGGAHRLTRARTTTVLSRPADTDPNGEPVRSDDELARAINTEHDHVETYKRNTIQHAVRCGELLLEMKQRVGHGNWLAWIEQHFQARPRPSWSNWPTRSSSARHSLT